LIKLSYFNAMSFCVLGWSTLEHEEGHFEFRWFDTFMDKLADNKAFSVMETPSGGKPS
jgi:beta-galactosidase